MRRIFGSLAILLGPSLALLFASGCGQGEGGRCQISSDCASGLVCIEGSTGNGVCKTSNAAVISHNDAAISVPEVEPTADSTPADDGPSATDAAPTSDAEPALDTEQGGAADATPTVDAGAIDTL
jgi:hypothetical protein